MTQRRLPLQRAVLSAAVLAALPYLVLKLMWMTGSTIGMTSEAEANEMDTTRFVAGNIATVVMMLVAVVFVTALTRPWGRRVPAWVVLVLGGGATGLLAPILLGLPLGLGIQLAVQGEAKPAADAGLAPWVFGIVYGGFGLLAVAMAVLASSYVMDRWGHLITEPPRPPSPLATLAGALGLLPFGAAMTYWGVFGPGTSGPQGMDLPAQRTVLVVTGVLSVAAFVTPFLFTRATRWPRLAWLVTWTGCSIAALQGPTLILLAHGGDVQPAIALIALLATPGSCVYGLRVLHRRTSGTLAVLS
jgi:hypothetical protein